MDRQQATLEQQYQHIMETALRQGTEQPSVPVAPAEAAFYFPWEYSPYRANGTTSAESGSNQG